MFDTFRRKKTLAATAAAWAVTVHGVEHRIQTPTFISAPPIPYLCIDLVMLT